MSDLKSHICLCNAQACHELLNTPKPTASATPYHSPHNLPHLRHPIVQSASYRTFCKLSTFQYSFACMRLRHPSVSATYPHQITTLICDWCLGSFVYTSANCTTTCNLAYTLNEYLISTLSLNNWAKSHLEHEEYRQKETRKGRKKAASKKAKGVNKRVQGTGNFTTGRR